MKKQYLVAVILVFAAIALGAVFAIFRQSGPPGSTQNLPAETVSPTAVQTARGEGAGFPAEATLPLDISQPADKAVVKSAQLRITGKTASSAEVSVNDLEVKADSRGNFSATLTFDEGVNTIVVIAVDETGNYAEKEITVNYEPES